MTEEYFSTEEKLRYHRTYGGYRDELCYAARRMEKIGAVPYNGLKVGKSEDVFKRALQQSKKENRAVALYLHSGTIEGMFMITPTYNPDWDMFVERAQQARWDKPIEEQKKEEEFDRFKNYEYGKRLYMEWDALTNEQCYAAERMEKIGAVPYRGRLSGYCEDIFKSALRQSKYENRGVALHLNSGEIQGMFLITPSCNPDWKSFVENAPKARWDKSIEEQKKEEKMMTMAGRLKGKEKA